MNTNNEGRTCREGGCGGDPARMGYHMTYKMVVCAGVFLLGLAAGERRALAQACAGDCNGDGQVSIDELIIGVDISLGGRPITACPAFEVMPDGQVTISELVLAVRNASEGCPAVRISGGCARPGPGPRGLVACDEGTPVTAYRCADRATCLGALSLPLAGSTNVEALGQWAMMVTEADASADLIFQANIDGATTFRTLGFGPVGGGGRLIAGGTPPADVGISPTSEAAVRVLDLNGLERFSDAGIAAVVEAVDAATSMLDFSVLASSGYSPADAADLATLTAVRDPAVIDAVEDGTIDPGVLPTRTPTPTLTQTPTATATPRREFALVTNLGSNNVSVIDTNTDAVIDVIDVGESPEGIAVTPDGTLALVANRGPRAGSTDVETVSIIDTAARQVVATVPDFSPNAFTRPSVVAVSSDGQLAYVTNNASATVDVLDVRRALTDPARARVGVIQVGPAPLGIALARSKPLALVASVESQTLSVVNTDLRQTVREVPLSAKPAFVVLTSDDALAYVTNRRFPGMPDSPANLVSVVDTQRALDNPADAVIGTIEVGSEPTGLALRSDDSVLYVVNASSASLSVTDREQVTTVPLLGGSLPQIIALTADGRRAYVSNCALDSVSVIDLERAHFDPQNAVLTTVSVGSCPQGVAIAELP